MTRQRLDRNTSKYYNYYTERMAEVVIWSRTEGNNSLQYGENHPSKRQTQSYSVPHAILVNLSFGVFQSAYRHLFAATHALYADAYNLLRQSQPMLDSEENEDCDENTRGEGTACCSLLGSPRFSCRLDFKIL